MHKGQAAIFQGVPTRSRYLTFVVDQETELINVLSSLSHMVDGISVVMGIGINVAASMRKEVPGLRLFPQVTNASVSIDSTPGDLWFWLRGDDMGELLHRGRAIEVIAKPAFKIYNVVDGFKYGHGNGMDLTGYEGGTQNPEDDEAVQAALMSGVSQKMDGSSFVVVQQWLHDLNYFEKLTSIEQDHVIGLNKASNEEIEEAPASAHIKRVEQDDFDPPAYIVRRSSPWIEHQQSGLMFLAFGHSFEAFEMQLSRMIGVEDGITDALFTFSKPMTGNYYWCPPLGEDGLNLAQLLSSG